MAPPGAAIPGQGLCSANELIENDTLCFSLHFPGSRGAEHLFGGVASGRQLAGQPAVPSLWPGLWWWPLCASRVSMFRSARGTSPSSSLHPGPLHEDQGGGGLCSRAPCRAVGARWVNVMSAHNSAIYSYQSRVTSDLFIALA